MIQLFDNQRKKVANGSCLKFEMTHIAILKYFCSDGVEQ